MCRWEWRGVAALTPAELLTFEDGEFCRRVRPAISRGREDHVQKATGAPR